MDRHTQKDSERSHSGQNTQAAMTLSHRDGRELRTQPQRTPAQGSCPVRSPGEVTGPGRRLWTVSSTRGSRAGSGAWPDWTVYHPKGPCLSCPARRPSPR